MKNRMYCKLSGFTLIELVLVIAILAILAFNAIPRLSGYIESARQTNDRQYAAELANAAAVYLAGNEDIEQVVDSPVGPRMLSPDELVSALVSNGVLAATYSDLVSLEQGLTSIEYKSGTSPIFNISYSNRAVTVVMSGANPLHVYTIVK